jgi:polysaccharide biosynthesis protein PslH
MPRPPRSRTWSSCLSAAGSTDTLPGAANPLPSPSVIATDTELRPDRGSRRLLICTQTPPRLDLRHGAKATAQLLARLADRHEIGILSLRATDEGPVDPVIADRCALVEEIPLPRTSSREVTARSRARFAIGFLRGLPPWVLDCRSDAYADRLRALAAAWQPDIVEIHLMAMAQYVTALESCRAARILVDYDPPIAWAAEAVRQARGPRRLARRAELATWRRYERSTRRRFDANVVFADLDVAAAAATAGGSAVVRIPLAYDVPQKPLDPIGQPPPTVLFVGGFRHSPNVDAARWLVGSIFPRVLERVPDARLELVGDRPGEEVQRLAAGPVTVHGSVPDVTPYLDRAAVVVAPIRLGGSMRGKVLEALVTGKALVATPRAAEGVDAAPGEHFILAATEDEIVDALSELLVNSGRRHDLARRARAWASQRLTWDRPLAAFEQLYAEMSPRESARRDSSREA